VARLLKPVSVVVFLLVALVSFAQTAPQSRIVQAIDNAQFTTLRGSAHPMAKPEFDRGPVDGSMQLHGVSIIFKASTAQQQALDTLLAQQQDRTSPNYHKWLRPQQFADRFGMAQADIAKVSTWLESKGFTVDRVTHSRTRISFTGTAAQIAASFHSEIHQYEVNGEKHFANASALSVPAALANAVLGFSGLNDFHPKPHLRRPPASPEYTSSISGNHYLAPEDFATIYDIKTLYGTGIDGTGQTIAIVGDSSVTISNIATFRSLSGLSVNNPTEVLVPGSGTPIIPSNDEQVEAYLDLEWSGAVAKNASIIYVYVGNNANFSVWDALQYAVDSVHAQVISTSFGFCESGLGSSFAAQLQALAQQANAQGQTITAASGDTGAADCDSNDPAVDGLAVDLPAAVPEVTGVGGTEFMGDASSTSTTAYWTGSNDADNGSAIKYIPEEVWNDTVLEEQLAAGGGGVSIYFDTPSWQTGSSVLNTGRNVPDISLNASNSHDSYLLCTGTNTQDGLASCTNGFRDSSQNLDPVGGTSAGAPTFAGIVALLDQAVDATGVGNVNGELYPLAVSAPSAFNDVTSGNNNVPCTPGTPASGPVALRCPSSGSMGFSAGAGYDRATGLGSIDVNNLVTQWQALSTAATFGLDGPTVTVASAGGIGSATVSVDALNGFSGTVNLTCAPPSSTAKITCSILPTSVTVNDSSSQATLTINTTAANAIAGTTMAQHRSGRLAWLAVSGGGMLAGVLMMGLPSRRRKYTAMFGMVLLAFIVPGVGCGGGGGGGGTSPTVPGTPAGSYTVTVTAVSGSITGTLNVAVTVQ
jgi:subtilase family serine protease